MNILSDSLFSMFSVTNYLAQYNNYFNVVVSVYCRYLKFYRRAIGNLTTVVNAAVSRLTPWPVNQE